VNTAEILDLKATALTGAVKLTWEVSSTSYLQGFVVVVTQNGKPLNAPRVNVAATAREATVAVPEGTGYTFNVEAIVAQGGRTVECNPLPVEPPPPPPPSSMIVAVDAGGWNWPTAVNDVAACVKHVRAQSIYYNNVTQAQLLSSTGLALMPLFTGGTSLGGINASAMAAEVVAWFKLYGAETKAVTCELLNEPGNPYFWSDPKNYTAYGTLIETVHAALAEAFPDPPTVLVSYDGGYEGDGWGAELLGAVPALSALDIAFTVHPYGGHGANSAEGGRARVTEAGATGKPVYVTEVGWPTDTSAAPTGDSLQWTEAQQVENIESFFKWAAGLGYVKGVTLFNYADYKPNNWYGIVDETGTRHKLSYAALHALSTSL
jgi:hypothetical protein